MNNCSYIIKEWTTWLTNMTLILMTTRMAMLIATVITIMDMGMLTPMGQTIKKVYPSPCSLPLESCFWNFSAA